VFFAIAHLLGYEVARTRESLPIGRVSLGEALELGGAPRSSKNRWPEPLSQAKKSDPLENAWHKELCNGTLTLKQARHAELAYKRAHG
jgi:hypothetical protein